jgi:hypothetical protein
MAFSFEGLFGGHGTASSPRAARDPGAPRAQKTCGNCGATGHNSRTCGNVQKEGGGVFTSTGEEGFLIFGAEKRASSGTRAPKTCSVCHEQGHDVRRHNGGAKASGGFVLFTGEER